MTGDRKTALRTAIIAAAIAAVTLTVFVGVLSADFVMWDDDVIIYHNPNLGGLSAARLWWALTDVNSMMRYNPLTLLGWVLTVQFFGMDPFWFHLGNWLLHAASAALCFLVLREILRRVGRAGPPAVPGWRIDGAAAAAALLWALHPLRVEPVAWATDRTYCQAACFLLLSLLLYLHAHGRAPEGRRCRRWLVAGSLASYTVSVFSYAIGIPYVLVLLIIDVWVLGRAGGAAGWRSTTARGALLEKAMFAVPAVAVTVISIAVRVASAGVWEPPVPLAEFGLWPRIMQALYIAARYLYRPFWPFNLSPVYTTLVSFNPLSAPFLASAGIVASVAMAAFALRRRVPALLPLTAAYLVLLIPEMGFLEHPHYPCDRYSLLPALVLSAALAMLLTVIRRRTAFIAAVAVTLAAAGGLGWLSVRQVRVWHDSETLFRHTIQTLGNDPYRQDIHWRLGKYLVQQRRYGEAIVEFERTLEINPAHAIAHHYLTDLELNRGNYQRAADHLRALVAIDPGNQLLRQKLDALLEYLKQASAPRDTTGDK